MKFPTTLIKQQIMLYGIGAAVLLAVGYGVYRFLKSPFETEGTPYESAGNRGGIPGAVGGLAAATDRISGGLLSEAGSAIAGTLRDLTEPKIDGLTYTFTFAETGEKGAVNSEDVDSRGFFTYFRNGKRYQLKQDQSGKRVAIEA